MSDEIIFGVRKEDWLTLKESVLKTHNRISELEADNERIKAGAMSSDENTGTRLTELEKTIELLHLGLISEEKSNKQESIKLRKEQTKGWKDYQYLQGTQIKRQDYLDEQINELKEDLLRLKNDYSQTYLFSIKPTKGVLRKFIDFQYHLYTMSQQYGDSETFEELLKELDGKTEKKYGPLWESIKHQNWKISGGEKESLARDDMSAKESSIEIGTADSSKQPEPKKIKCLKCGYFGCDCKSREDEERSWDDDWKEDMRERIKKIFPNEDLVKREKIEFWRKELLNKTDEVLKAMREVLGI